MGVDRALSVRVNELAKELGMTSKSVIERLAKLGVYARSPSSLVDSSDVARFRELLGQPSKEFLAGIGDNRRLSTWNSGAVRPSQHPDTIRNLENLKRRFPVVEEHQVALSGLGSQFLYSSLVKMTGFEDCGFALVRFSGAIESAFGFTREVLFFYSPYRDLQIRTFRAAKSMLARIDREVTPDVIFFHAPDPRLREKLDDWSSGGLLAVPLSMSADGSLSFVSLLRDYIFSRDLFYETTPVQGERFFGRRQLLQSLRDDIRNQRVAGLFGLRKAGKTSVLSELANNLSADDKIVLLRDLESLPSPPEDPVPDLLRELTSNLLAELRSRDQRALELSRLSDTCSVSEFKTAFQATLRRLSRAGIDIVLLLDEIEYLTPSDRIDIEEGDLTAVAQLLGVLRSLVQENENFTFMLSGLTSSIIESGRLYGRPNPLFSWAKAYFLSPFERHEADSLAVSVGQKMGITIENGALEALFEASGGHAFMYRHLASRVVTTELPVDVFHRRMTRVDVLRATQSWRLQIAGNMREMLDHIKRYYPDESYLLEILREEPESFPIVADTAPMALGHLIGLGLVRVAGTEYELTPVLHLL
jgi:hypothetical protein